MPLIDCKNLSLSYGSHAIIEDLSFLVERNDYLYIVGENGSGKSTLIKGILGLLKPSKGEIKIADDVKRTEIGYLPQMTTAQKNFPASVYEIVLSGCLNKRGMRPTYTKENKETALDNLKKFKIDHLKNTPFYELSGGQQERVLLARALSSTRKILILDEPTNGLDPKATIDFYTAIDKLNKEDGITMIIVSHDIKSAVTFGKHILHLSHDKTFFDTAAKYKKSVLSEYFMLGGHHD